MRLLDVFVSVVGLLLLFPIIIIISILIKLTSDGPVIFSHLRVGKHGKEFNCYKFRSMVKGADKIGGYMTEVNDRRITPIGQFIRKYSIDELPQLFNVIKGEMSLVGPRPDTPMQKNLYTEEQWKTRHNVRPGITGLAQVKARHTATNKMRLKYDLFYVENKSLFFDIYLVYKTILNLIFKKSY
ncbi:MAG: sugar transferase [Balneola sp.]|jgi:lipopolysaccharide/colanic/teichoic acid biosynthesis glycosyltransferase